MPVAVLPSTVMMPALRRWPSAVWTPRSLIRASRAIVATEGVCTTAVVVRMIGEHEQDEEIAPPGCWRFVERPAHQPDAHDALPSGSAIDLVMRVITARPSSLEPVPTGSWHF